MNWISHTTFILIVAVIPLVSMSSMRKLRRIADLGRLPDLTLNNLSGALVLWLCTLGVLLAWHHQDGIMDELGLTVPTAAAWLIGLVVIFTAFAIIRWSAGRIRSSFPYRQAFLDSMEYVIAILPRNRRERNSFYLLSVTAGICEEVIYRGFVFAYLLSYLDLVSVVVVSSLLFGIAHAYQGLKGVPQTGLVGLVLALLYVYTGSLWASMVLHAAIDLGYGYLGWLALQQGDDE